MTSNTEAIWYNLSMYITYLAMKFCFPSKIQLIHLPFEASVKRTVHMQVVIWHYSSGAWVGQDSNPQPSNRDLFGIQTKRKS